MDEKVCEFQVGEILPLVLILGVATIGVVYVIDILADVRDDQAAGTAERNASVAGIEAIAKFPEKFGIIATIIVAVILIGMLTRYLMVR